MSTPSVSSMRRVPRRLLNRFQALSSLSVASVLSVQAERSRSLESISARLSSLESAASIRSKSIESQASVASVQSEKPSDTGNGNDNNSNSNNSSVALVGGVIGAFLGVTVLVLIYVLLWRRKRGVPASSKPIPPAISTSLPFSTNPNSIDGPPDTHVAQPGWHPQHSSLLSLPSASAPAVTQTQASIPSRQSSSPPPAVKTWIEGPSTVHQEMHRRLASQSSSLAWAPTGGPVDPRGLYTDALRGSMSSVAAPPNDPSSASRRTPHVPPYSFVSEKAEFSG